MIYGFHLVNRPRANTNDERLRRLTKSERDRRRSKRISSSDIDSEHESDSGGSAGMDESDDILQQRYRKRASSKASYDGVEPRHRKRPSSKVLRNSTDIEHIEEVEQDDQEVQDSGEIHKIDPAKLAGGASTSTLVMNSKDIYFGTWKPGERAVLDQILHNIDLKPDKKAKQKNKSLKKEQKSKRKDQRIKVDGQTSEVSSDAHSESISDASPKTQKKSFLNLFGLRKFKGQNKKEKQSIKENFDPLFEEGLEEDPLQMYMGSPPVEKKKSKTDMIKDLFTRVRSGTTMERGYGRARSHSYRERSCDNSPNVGRPRTRSLIDSSSPKETRVRSRSVNETSRPTPPIPFTPPSDRSSFKSSDRSSFKSSERSSFKSCESSPKSEQRVQDAVISDKPPAPAGRERKKSSRHGSRTNLSKQRSASIRSIDSLRNMWNRTKSVDNLNGAFQFYVNKEKVFKRSSSVSSLSGTKNKRGASTERLDKKSASQSSLSHCFEPVKPSVKELGYNRNEKMVFAQAHYIQPQVAVSSRLPRKSYHDRKHEHSHAYYDSAYEDDSTSGYHSETGRSPSVASAFPAFNRSRSDGQHSPRGQVGTPSAKRRFGPQTGPSSPFKKSSGYQSGSNSESEHTNCNASSSGPATPNTPRKISLQRIASKNLSQGVYSSSFSHYSENSFFEDEEVYDVINPSPSRPRVVVARNQSSASFYSNMSTDL